MAERRPDGVHAFDSPRRADAAVRDDGSRCDDAAVELDLVGLRSRMAVMPSVSDEAEAIDRLRELEELKAACAAAQARTADELKRLRHEREAAAGVPRSKRGTGLDVEVALARMDAPARGSKHLGLATALVHEMPQTMSALTDGRIAEEHATVVCQETAWLPVEHRRTVDQLIAGRLGTIGVRTLKGLVRRHAQRLDQEAAVQHLERARRERRVTARPAPGNMAYLTALLPMQQAVAVLATLNRDATTLVGTGDTADPRDPSGQERTRDQIMADLLVQRATGQIGADVVPAEVSLVMTDAALFAADRTPVWLNGHGAIPAPVARAWLANPEVPVFLRRIFTHPQTGQLTGMESRGRSFPPNLRRLILLRDDVCRMPYCDAPIREIDHITPYRDAGNTSWDNASGLCSACNQTKEARGWMHEGSADALEVFTPTGHRHQVVTPPLMPELLARNADAGDPEHGVQGGATAERERPDIAQNDRPGGGQEGKPDDRPDEGPEPPGGWSVCSLRSVDSPSITVRWAA